MIKWAECREGEVLYEFFLPEHESELCQWMLRVSARGHVLEERRGRLTWTPRFGPDAGDVAVVEAATEQLVQKYAGRALPETVGTYRPQDVDLPNVDPITHAINYGLVEEFAHAESVFGLSLHQIGDYLQLPVQKSASGLHPFAVTEERAARMQRLVTLMQILRAHPEAQVRRQALLDAVLGHDINSVTQILGELGLTSGADRSRPP